MDLETTTQLAIEHVAICGLTRVSHVAASHLIG